MALQPGTRLGPYEILAPIGAGGMGEVYKARDTRLDRTVAIKVLPQHVASDPELKQRFEREAKTISSLNHPHICTLHDIGQQDGTDFLVMEYLEGETVAQRITKGALPIDQVLRYAIEIADALDKAHRQGVTHRDLKPGNIMITKAGTKLLDFGLAKLRDPKTATLSISQRPTQSASLTGEGKILGTLQYMAPEQLEGQDADARTDIFALGVVLYEAATGRKAFEGKTQASLAGAILRDEPPSVSSLHPTVPPVLDRIVARCLAKDPDDRWQTARDLVVQFKWIAEGSAELSVPGLVTVEGHNRERLAWGIAALGVVASLAVLLWWVGVQPASRPVSHFDILPPLGKSFYVSPRSIDVVVTPDGSRIVYNTLASNQVQLIVRERNQYQVPQPVGGGAEFWGPFASPDGAWIGFYALNPTTLLKAPIDGGSPVTICETDGNVWGASWGADDTIIFATASLATGLWQVSAHGGEPQLLTTPDGDEGEVDHRWPEILPGGEAVLFTIVREPLETSQIAVLSRATGEQKILLTGGTGGRYLATGHLVYGTGDTLRALPFDPDRLEVTGRAALVLDGVSIKETGAVNFSVSHDGLLVYVPAEVFGQRDLDWVDREAGEENVVSLTGNMSSPRLSPDGRFVAIGRFLEDPTQSDVWVYEVARGALTRVTSGGGYNPVWTPDGRRITFRQPVPDGGDIYWVPWDGSGEPEALVVRDGNQSPQSWSPDGDTLAFHELNSEGNWDIWLLKPDGQETVTPFAVGQFDQRWPRFSPDGRWIAYASNDAGQDEVYVRPQPGPGGRRPISTGGGSMPIWSANGQELFYSNGSQVLAVPVETSPEFRAGTPEVLLEGPYLFSSGGYDISRDGRRLLMLKRALGSESTPALRVVLNWFQELQRLVPTP